MMSDLDKILNELTNYAKDLDTLHIRKMYVEEIDKTNKDSGFAEQTEDNESESKPKKIETKSHTNQSYQEFDLFGNIIAEKKDWQFAANLSELNQRICNCMDCSLGETRKKFVFGVGNPKSDVVFIGEAPGADEDAQGEPFVGRAGQLLNKILAATDIKREDVYICNILKCRPPGNRNPLPDEVEKCKPYLDYQLNLIKPKFIMALGRVAAETMLKTKLPLNKLRGKMHEYNGFRLLVTFHPAALLRNPNWKKDAWDDMKYLKKLILENK